MRYLPLRPWLAFSASVILGLISIWLLIDLATFLVWFSLLLLFTGGYFMLLQVVLPKVYAKRLQSKARSRR